MARVSRYLFLFWLVPGFALGGTVRSVEGEGERWNIAPSPTDPWAKGEAVCVVRKNERLACGVVEAVLPTGAAVRVTLKSTRQIRPGDTVERTPFTAQVLGEPSPEGHVSITHPANGQWKLGDAVCFHRKGDLLACAEVAKVGDGEVRADLFWTSGVKTQGGDSVRPAPGRARLLNFSPEGQLVIAQPRVLPWRTGETVGVLNQGEVVAWGEVVRSYPLTAEVRVVLTKGTFDEGDWVRPQPLPDLPKNAYRRRLAHAETVVFRDSRRTLVNLGLLSAFPRFVVEYGLLPRLAVGVSFTVAQGGVGGGKLSGLGAIAQVTYYPAIFPAGVWMTLGLGAFQLNAARGGVEETLGSPAALALMGWRWAWTDKIYAGAGGGALFLSKTSGDRVFLNTSGVIPALCLELGHSF